MTFDPESYFIKFEFRC